MAASFQKQSSRAESTGSNNTVNDFGLGDIVNENQQHIAADGGQRRGACAQGGVRHTEPSHSLQLLLSRLPFEVVFGSSAWHSTVDRFKPARGRI
jgi:hypothetical protein